MKTFLHAIGYSIVIYIFMKLSELGGWRLHPNYDGDYINIVFSIMIGIGMRVLFNHIEK